ncbi:carph-isopro domain-containing protein [uncultured Brevundimonas sp.]|uniref:carph-isopro domain-containing protein n=1 Tax=uncultured Brevundimonas sp. TaxID=213418 RepID=UPI00342465E8
MTQEVSRFIDECGGNAAVAQATGYSAGAVALWRHRNRLPRSAWPEIMLAYPKVRLSDLMAIEKWSSVSGKAA